MRGETVRGRERARGEIEVRGEIRGSKGLTCVLNSTEIGCFDVLKWFVYRANSFASGIPFSISLFKSHDTL